MAPQFVPGVLVEVRGAKGGDTFWLELNVNDDTPDRPLAVLVDQLKDRGVTFTGQYRIKERPEPEPRPRGYARRAAFIRA